MLVRFDGCCQVFFLINTVGPINFEDKTIREFRGYLLNHEIKYPCNFLYACTDEGHLQHTILCLFPSTVLK